VNHYLLFYEAGDDYAARRAPFRQLHLDHAWAAEQRGELVLAGALGDPIDGAVFLFQGADAEAAERFALEDPYVVNGVVKQWRVRPWLTVVGSAAAAPLGRPGG
jgi:uncharacterized protein